MGRNENTTAAAPDDGAARGLRPRTGALLAGSLSLAVLLAGCMSLQEVFPKAFPPQEAQTTAAAMPTGKPAPSPASQWKTARTKTGDMTFKVRKDWTVEAVPAERGSSSIGIPAYQVLAEDGRVLATLQQHPGSSTIQAMPGAEYVKLDSVPAPDVPTFAEGAEPVVAYDVTLYPNSETRVVYGLTSGRKIEERQAPGGEIPVGAGYIGYPKLAGPLMFQGFLQLDVSIDGPPQHEQALDVARRYMFSQEYVDVVEMISSLRYDPEAAQGTATCEGPTFNLETINLDCDSATALYNRVRLAQDYLSVSGSQVTVRGDAGLYRCTLKEMGAELDGRPPGYGVDGTCAMVGGYARLTATWADNP